MLSQHVQLQEGEQVLFENERVVLTNQRVLANFKTTGNGTTPRDQALIKDIATVQQVFGGQESRLGLGLKLLGAGVALGALQLIWYFVLGSIPRHVEGLLFLVSAVLAGVGGYMLVTSFVRVMPHTTVLFIIFGRKEIAVTFPGKFNEEADKLANAFARAKRAL
ncbi:MAG: hypothetical protein FJ312_05185 [SAR202 cluster bacterium]|nr:hypothetical protein [SAR202 cluster bacterium]